MMHLRFSNGTIPVLFEAGRLCLPVFVIILAYNLARPEITVEARLRTMKRLLVFGILSSIPFIALGGLLAGWWPLNILFTLLVMTMIVLLIEKGGIANLIVAAFVFLIAGSSVEFWWPAVALGIAAWSYFKQPNILAASLGFLSCSALWLQWQWVGASSAPFGFINFSP